MNEVYIVGAGCGDPDLITVKGKKLLDMADILIYAGSLVNPVLVENCPASEKYDSWGMKLEEMTKIMSEGAKSGKIVVRLHSGDPSLYGAIIEQVTLLKQDGIETIRVPGVSSMFGAAAALGTQLTLRGVSESVIVTRPAGTTLKKDQIAEMSELGETMVIFLGTEHMEEIFAKVRCPPDTPAAVVYKATWPDEKIIKGTVSDVAKKARYAGIDKTALIIIGKVVDAIDSGFVNSYLYE
ncbi:cobalt-precorrin-4/precorrin-4 C(11)-methyltransferase [Methanomicrobium antiquum]|uniref:Cobalt-precorrin-4/precorrin-4 C(11)-methyltransferase n=1 Tax=Methanomicrobium antiquum TaxID=487686 RepID=A0AAF0FXC1_9EURY|nr:cobalt-precorrin-4/precorrin-4 C(11)-methyltransferase [Methanomicrobium antiquum]WFN37685.1 cobalt-precorrin-4/precorrin-4 C(11)-methyltransferase [Methanomicrobium antiquum]